MQYITCFTIYLIKLFTIVQLLCCFDKFLRNVTTVTLFLSSTFFSLCKITLTSSFMYFVTFIDFLLSKRRSVMDTNDDNDDDHKKAAKVI